MIMKNKRLLILLILGICLMVSCVSSRNNEDSVQSRTLPPKVLPSATHIPATFTPTILPTHTVTATPTEMPTPFGGAQENILVSILHDKWEKLGMESTGEFQLFESNAEGDQVHDVAPELGTSTQLEGVSPDGKVLLIGADNHLPGFGEDWSMSLVLFDRETGQTTLICKHYRSFVPDQKTVFWLSQEDKIAFVGADEGPGIYLYDLSSKQTERITEKKADPLWIWGADETYLYWEKGQADSRSIFWDGLYRTPIAGGETQRLPLDDELKKKGLGANIVISPTGDWAAYRLDRCPEELLSDNDSSCPYLFITQPDSTNYQDAIRLENMPYDFWWADNGNDLLFDICDSNNSCGKQGKYYLYDVKDHQLTEIPEITQKNFFRLRWSPDSKQILFWGYPPYILDLPTRQVRTVLEKFDFQPSDYIQNLDWYFADWIPAPR